MDPKTKTLDLGADDVHTDALTPLEPQTDAEKDALALAKKKAPRKLPKKGGLRMRVQLAGGHQLEVRHNGDVELDDVRLTNFDHFALADVDHDVVVRDGKKLVWNQIAKLGHFEGHASGPFDFTSARFDEMVRNFREIDQKTVAFDFEHASEADETSGSIPTQGAPACGWIHELENRGANGLFALVEWLEPARGYVKEGRYKQVSPAVRFNAKHPITGARIGARLTSVALTNKPFLRGMQPVAAKDKPRGALGSSVVDMGDFLRKACSALQMSQSAMPHEMKDEIGRLRQHYELSDDHHGASALGLHLGRYTDGLAQLMPHVAASGTMEDLLAAVESKIDEAIATHNLERHDGGASMSSDEAEAVTATDSSGGSASETQEAEKIMNEKEMELKLKAEETKATDLARQLADEKAKSAELTCKLSASEAKSTVLETRVVAIEKSEEARTLKAQEDEVDSAIAVYGADGGAKPENRAAMLTLLKANSEGFRKIWPQTNPQDRFLASVISGTGRTADPARTVEQAASLTDKSGAGANGRTVVEEDDEEVDEMELISKYTAKGLDWESACLKASSKLEQRKAARH